MTVDEPAPFRPRPPWLTGDLQTIRNTIRRDAPDPGPFARLWLDLPDGDALAAAWHASDGTWPTVVLIHGLTGSEDSQYMRRSAVFWRARGHGVLRIGAIARAQHAPLQCRRRHGHRARAARPAR
jgi:predicted alpha/beta-fold hydrolase